MGKAKSSQRTWALLKIIEKTGGTPPTDIEYTDESVTLHYGPGEYYTINEDHRIPL